MKRLFTGIILGFSAFFGCAAEAQETSGGYDLVQQAVYAKAHQQALAPMGFIDFCKRFPDSCARERSTPARTALTPERLRELVSVNDHVNQKIHPETDQDLYGVEEHWTIPVDAGDCEDYALLKKYYLEQLGWPRSTLLMTVVIDERGDGHAVLMVKTTAGDLVLDNQNPTVLDWTKTPYDYVKRQSSYDPKIWESLDKNQRNSPAAVAAR